MQKFIVQPEQFRKGYCRAIYHQLKKAEAYRTFMERFTGFAWIIIEVK